MESVKPLSEAARNSIRSGIILYDLTRVVEELVLNSLDASATKVSVYVGVGTCYVKVVDDGSGISRDGLVLLGERYVTSKLHHSVDKGAANGSFGFRGEALASISEVSLLEIMTKAYGKPSGYRKVIKGSKCLYLGINDDRKDVGTAVIVRDLFYNQPVRRKYMKSSPKKVLYSIKKCVHRIALMQPKVSFKVVDIESEDVLLQTHTSSTLSRVMIGFGIEDSSSLLQLNVSHGALNLSGYVSVPRNSFSIKDFQYVYINSRFVCKGPVHKLMNNLATKFEDLDLYKANSLSQKGKRSRPQTYPAYILNLCCPTSLYELTFEPSKTYVEFKDWCPILTFVEKTIRQLWQESEESSSHSADIFQKDETWNKCKNFAAVEDDIAAVDLLENSESELMKCGTHNHQSCHHPTSALFDVLTKEVDHASYWKHGRVPCEEFPVDVSEFEQHAGKHSVCERDCTISSWNGHPSEQKEEVSQNSENDLLIYDNNFWLPNGFSQDRFASTERSSDHMEDPVLCSEWQDESPKIGYSGHMFSLDFPEFSNYLNSSKNDRNSFLQRCSSQRNLPLERAVLTSEERFEFTNDSFKSKRRRLCDDTSMKGYVNDEIFDVFPGTLQQNEVSNSQLFALHSTEVDMPADFDLFPGATSESFSPDRNLSTEAKSSDFGSFLHRESFHSGPHFLYPESCETSDAIFMAKAGHCLDDDDASEGSSRLGKRESYWHFEDGEAKKCKSTCDIIPWSSSQDDCILSSTCTVLDNISDSFGDVNKILEGNNSCDEFSSKCSDDLDWLLIDSNYKDHDGDEQHKFRRNQLRYQDWREDHNPRKRPIRSHSAPPFYRCRGKIISLNHHLKQKEEEVQAQLFHNEADGLKHQYRPPNCTENLDFSTSAKKKPDIIVDKEKEIQKDEHFEHLQSTLPLDAAVEGFLPEETGGSIDHGTKWRYTCQPIAKHNATVMDNKDDILNISSGFLHLAGISLVPESLHKNFLKNAEVLSQVDKKFIPIVAGGTLAVIDQHAADERIRLEELRQKVLSGDAKTVSYLDAENELILPEIGYQLLHNYAEKIREWGWIWNTRAQVSGTFERNLNILHQQPTAVTLLAVPCILGVNLSDGDLLEYLQQLAETDGSSTMPPSVLRVLNSKACRGAIMFGDSLLPSECALIVEELKQTSLCFQCAHGRPTTVPLVNLKALREQITKLGVFLDGDSSNSWHGLHQKELSIERAARRLRAAGGRSI